MINRRSRAEIPELRNPGDPEPLNGSPGSIEQKLDMVEDGDLRGEEAIRPHLRVLKEDEGLVPVDELLQRTGYEMDMSEPDREGDEMSGDEHSSGLQGGEPELHHQPQIESGLPGDETEKDDDLPRPATESD